VDRAHGRLVSLAELAAPAGETRLQAAAATVLHWLTSRSRRRSVKVIDARTRRCAARQVIGPRRRADERPLHHMAVTAQPLARVDPAAGDPRDNPAAPQGAPQRG
jgi:hypothetical protein